MRILTLEVYFAVEEDSPINERTVSHALFGTSGYHGIEVAEKIAQENGSPCKYTGCSFTVTERKAKAAV